jgi:hypothetical protein
MLSEIDGLTAAQNRQDTLLAEASNRRMARIAQQQGDTASAPSGRRLPAIFRRLVGAPTFA